MNSLLFVLYFVVCVGTAYFYGTFVKIQIGRLYILEAIAIGIFSLAFISLGFRKKNHVKKVFCDLRAFFLDVRKPLLPALLLFIYGLFVFGIDIFVRRSSYDISTQRIAQHALIAFYPLIWIGAGVWIGRRERIVTDVICWTIFLCSLLANMQGMLSFNYSIGPLLGLSAMLTWVEIFREKRLNKVKILLAVFLTVVLFLPYLRLWQDKMQRTSLVGLIFTFITVPFLMEVNARKPRWLVAFKSSFLVLGLFLLASAVVVIHRSDSIQTGLINALQKGEDIPLNSSKEEQSKSVFQQRFRRYLRNQAVSAWQTAPFFGVGFLPEVPAYLRDGVKNDGNFSQYPDMTHLPPIPVSGPHNSYLNLLARLGVIGLGCFLWMLIATVTTARDVFFRQKLTLADLILIFVPINGLIYAAFNNGFEGPQNAVLLWLFLGIISGLGLKKKLNP